MVTHQEKSSPSRESLTLPADLSVYAQLPGDVLPSTPGQNISGFERPDDEFLVS